MSEVWQRSFLSKGAGLLLLAGASVAFGTQDARAALPANCSAVPENAKARGEQAMLEQHYELALSCYELAYAAHPAVALLYNRARALEMLQRNREALDLLEQFEREAPPSLLARVPQLIELKATIQEAIVAEPSPHPPEPTLVLEEPSQPLVSARREPAVSAPAPAVASELALALAPAAVYEPLAENGPAPKPVGDIPAWATWTAFGVGAGGSVAAVVSLVVALEQRDKICAGQEQCTEDTVNQNARDSYERLAVVLPITAVIGAVGLSVGGVLLWKSAETSVEVSLSPLGASLQGQF